MSVAVVSDCYQELIILVPWLWQDVLLTLGLISHHHCDETFYSVSISTSAWPKSGPFLRYVILEFFLTLHHVVVST